MRRMRRKMLRNSRMRNWLCRKKRVVARYHEGSTDEILLVRNARKQGRSVWGPVRLMTLAEAKLWEEAGGVVITEWDLLGVESNREDKS